ncbi:hypothetical protein PUMCH_001675 [Australozyma saopauloensis]|uniref:Uncharacterized protein n=1 Tax=Australozyma saopauloensis TaxID=291208 RepID=A0AAX4H8V2_9ASCO|nr:hypothetical protein PUMCH_001675 [[Candida] saopauloensis]
MGADVPVFIVLGTPDGDGWFGPMGWCFCGGGGVWSLGIGRWMYVFDGRTAGGAAGDVEGVGRNCGYLCEFLVLKGTNRYRFSGAVSIYQPQFFAFVCFSDFSSSRGFSQLCSQLYSDGWGHSAGLGAKRMPTCTPSPVIGLCDVYASVRTWSVVVERRSRACWSGPAFVASICWRLGPLVVGTWALRFGAWSMDLGGFAAIPSTPLLELGYF